MKHEYTNNDTVVILIRAKTGRVWRNGKVKLCHAGPFKPGQDFLFYPNRSGKLFKV